MRVAFCMAKISHFRELRVWRAATDIVVEVYRISSGFPKAEAYGLMSQVRRAAVSVPSNIAEGHTRATTKKYLNHLAAAQASLAEVETQLEIASRLGYRNSTEFTAALERTGSVGKQLHALRSALAHKI